MVGQPGKLPYEVVDKRLVIDVPARPEGQPAYAFKLTGFKSSLTPEAARAREESLKKVQADLMNLGQPAAKTAKKKAARPKR